MASATFITTLLLVSLFLTLPYAVFGGSSGLDLVSRVNLPNSAPEGSSRVGFFFGFTTSHAFFSPSFRTLKLSSFAFMFPKI